MVEGKQEGNVTFYEDTHEYIFDNGYVRLKLNSVNQVISLFLPEFNADEVIQQYYEKWQNDKKSKYYGMSKVEIKSDWDKKRDDACKYGTFVHKEIEDLFEGSEIGEYNVENDYYNVSPEVEAFKEWYEKEWDKGWRLYATEKIVYDVDYNIAGTVDLILYNDELSNIREYKIVDFKTNDREKLYKESREYMKKPLSHLMASTLEKYYLQLNTYSKLFDKFNCKMVILSLSDTEYIEIPVPNRQKEVKFILDKSGKSI